MGSKFGLAGGIPERRVRPIWDAVESRQFKTGLKLCTSLLAKYPNSPYALALKALILERMGKPDEALGVCLNAKEQLCSNDIVHADDLTLSTLQIVFQRLDRLDMATSCYEHACSKYTNNLELMMGLFNCYVREYSFVKQQQTAIKMYKIVGEERFLLWAVCSIQLQVFCSDDGEKLLPLAEALLKKHITSHSLHEPEGLLIYTSILEQQAKYGAALEVLSGDLGSLIVIEVDKLRMKGRLLARACDYAAAADTFQKVLESCPDDWESFLHYLGCLLEEDLSWSSENVGDQVFPSKGIDESRCSHLTEELFEKCILSALSFVQKLQMEAHNESIRCPYLATIEIEKRRRLYGKADNGKLLEALLKYFCRFGHLSCFTSDVETFVHVLTDEEKRELLGKFTQASECSSILSIQTLGQAITLYKIQELFGSTFRVSLSDLKDSSRRMVEMYCSILSFSKDLDPQDSIHGEELLLLACNVLVQLFWRTRQLGYLLEGIMILEFGLAIRRHVWQYKILLLHLYSHLGALPLAYEWYGTLEVKNILLETVSHHILPQMLKSHLWLDLAELINEYLKFMDDYMRDAADLTFLAYRHRNYSKVIEFVQFKERLQHSSQYLMAKVEASILQLKQKADNLEETESALENLRFGTQLLKLSNEEECKSLTFNEDLQSRPWWSPTPDVNYLLEPFEANLVHLGETLAGDKKAVVRKDVQRRSLLPRLIYLSIQAALSPFRECIEANGSTFDSANCSELKSLLENYSRILGYPFDEAVEVITGLSEGRRSTKDFDSDMVYWMEFTVFANARNLYTQHLGQPSGDECSRQISWNIVNSLILRCVTEQLRSAKPLLTCPGSNLPVLVQLVTESCSWHILVIQSCVRAMLPFGKKKKKSGAVDQLNTPLAQAIRSSVQLLGGVIENVKKWLDDQIKQPEEESLDVLLSHLQKRGSEEGPGHIYHILEEIASVPNPELGERISQALQSWSYSDVMRRMIKGQCTVLSEFYRICDSKSRLLESLRQSI